MAPRLAILGGIVCALLAPAEAAVPARGPATRAAAATRDRLVRLGTHPAVAERAARHLLLGFPSAATRTNPIDYLLVRNGSVSSYNSDRNGINWVSWNVRKSDLGILEREGRFHRDPTLPKNWYQPIRADYMMDGEGSRGHMVRSGERRANAHENSKTFYFPNVLPQAKNNNEGPWLHLENYYREAVNQGGKEAHVIAGGLFEGPRVGKVAVPTHTWKVVALVEPGQTAAQISERTRVIAVIIPNNNREVDKMDSFAKYRVSVAEVERRTGLRFFSELSPATAEKLKSRVDGEKVPERIPFAATPVPPAPAN